MALHVTLLGLEINAAGPFMPNHNAFISELYYQSNTGITEFIEVTLKASEDPADYTLSFYTETGT